jgi:hypothetical protein
VCVTPAFPDYSTNYTNLQFRTVEFKVPYPEQADRSYAVRFREVLPALLDIIEDDLLRDRIILYPEHRYISHPDGGLMRIWEEYSSGDDWWDLQVRPFSHGQLI